MRLLLIALLLLPTGAFASPCARLFNHFASSESSLLQRAYKEFLEHAQRSAPKNMPKAIEWRGQRFEVVNFLGGGAEANVFRVRAPNGEESILKVYFAYTDSTFRKARDYLQLQREGLSAPRILSLDTERKIIQFENNRSIPLDLLPKFMEGMPQDLREKVLQEAARAKSAAHDDYNQAFDIDTFRVLVLDPY